MLAAPGYLIDGLAHLLVAGHVKAAAYLALPIAVSEVAFPLWLLFKGANAEQWERRASVEPGAAVVTA